MRLLHGLIDARAVAVVSDDLLGSCRWLEVYFISDVQDFQCTSTFAHLLHKTFSAHLLTHRHPAFQCLVGTLELL